jgi:histidyl-tRNA synthetase
MKGITEIQFICENVSKLGFANCCFRFRCNLARGLNYYTGVILSCSTKGSYHGSIGGGGRYDRFNWNFWFENMSGVGISVDWIEFIF